MKRCQIRQAIEQILGKKFSTCFIDGNKNSFRMKLVGPNIYNLDQIYKIKKLPHVIKVRYWASSRPSSYFSNFGGIAIYFDVRPKSIKL